MPKKASESEWAEPTDAESLSSRVVTEEPPALDAEAAEEIVRPLQQSRQDPEALSVEARVVYRGTHPTKGLYYRGTADAIQDPMDATGLRRLWRPSPEGATFYDFSRLDAHGRVIEVKLTRDGFPFSICRHIGHLVRFMRETDEDGASQFEIRAMPEIRRKLERYMTLQTEAKLRNQDSGAPVLQAMGLL